MKSINHQKFESILCYVVNIQIVSNLNSFQNENKRNHNSRNPCKRQHRKSLDVLDKTRTHHKMECSFRRLAHHPSRNDLRIEGKFLSRMEAKDGSFGFDFEGVYTDVIINGKISYTLLDDRKVTITFSQTENGIQITETFEAENQNPLELQKLGWQAILNNFKNYVENN